MVLNSATSWRYTQQKIDAILSDPQVRYAKKYDVLDECIYIFSILERSFLVKVEHNHTRVTAYEVSEIA